MASYGALQSDIAAWLVAEDIAARIPTLISLAEDRHKWGVVGPAGIRGDYGGAIRVREMERRATATGFDSVYLAMPDPCLEHRSLAPVIDGNVDVPLVNVGNENIARATANNRAGRPTTYCIERKEFRFDAVLAGSSTVELIYYVPFDRLTDAAPSNWLLENAYGAYLYAALAEAEPYLRDDERVTMWEGKYAQIVKALNDTERRSQRSRSAIITKPLRAMP